MNGRESFDDALDAAIDQVRSGWLLADVLAAHPQHVTELRPLLEASQSVNDAANAAIPPMPQGLADNFTIVRAALERERMAQAQPPVTQTQPRAPWWQRRWTVASLSMPAAFVLAALFAGAGGAAAATVAVSNTNLGRDVIAAITPDWAGDVVPSALHLGDDDGDNAGNRAADNREDAPGINNDSGQGAHPPITITGVIGDPHGNTFTLSAGDDEWNVQFDSNTEISGGIVDGANATVTGAETGSQTVHGTQISTDAGAESPVERGPSGDGNNGNPPGTDGNNGNGPATDGNNGNGPGPDANNGNPQPGSGSNNGSAPGVNSSSSTPSRGKPTPTPEAIADDEQSASDNGPPGQANSPSGGNGPNENSGMNNAGGNGGGPKKP
jgi:hypothetical protein